MQGRKERVRIARTADVAALRAVVRQVRGAKLYLVSGTGGRRVQIGRTVDESTLQLLVEAIRCGGRLELVLDRTQARREMIESDVVAAR